MKAFVCTKYGPPEVLELREVKKPAPKDNEVLIKIHATTVTAGDVRIRSSTFPLLVWPLVRIILGVTKPRQGILGHEVAGEIKSVGKGVKRFRPGDKVFGSTGVGSGTHAEYICLPEEGTVIAKPASMTYAEAAAVPVGGLTALHFLRKGNIQSGQKVLVHGASGSVGSYAVQIAKSFGAEVTGVCGAKNLELVRSLGADGAIDYTKRDAFDNGPRYDLIFDAVGKTSFWHYRRSLAPRGAYVTVAKGIVQERAEDLVFLRELIVAGKMKPVIDRSYPFDQIAEAHRYVENGHKKGNVVIAVSP